MDIAGQFVWTRSDLQQVLQALLAMHNATVSAGSVSPEYNAGVQATVAAIAVALGIDVDTYTAPPTVVVRQFER